MINGEYTLGFGAGAIGILVSEEQYNDILEQAKETGLAIETREDDNAEWKHIRKNGRLIATLAHWKDSYEER